MLRFVISFLSRGLFYSPWIPDVVKSDLILLPRLGGIPPTVGLGQTDIDQCAEGSPLAD